jgi:hypothetical protein
MRKTVQSLVLKKRNELHMTVVSDDKDQFIRERDTIIEFANKEKLMDRYKRLC